ncbi:hypothetical protein POX_g08611 [Penicillium oxalicum]|uniref:hypothetical protein n=1 Tax=Penicillium oxalicum TaxID=69781 RepID=UPI0020B72532|nr:hypothetical protein POX_g08611 [Penicillium oxalicum]KAI2786229.1 hypothetical protein POX_g08611 [Penicillium oxalicum]
MNANADVHLSRQIYHWPAKSPIGDFPSALHSAGSISTPSDRLPANQVDGSSDFAGGLGSKRGVPSDATKPEPTPAPGNTHHHFHRYTFTGTVHRLHGVGVNIREIAMTLIGQSVQGWKP